MKYYISKLYNPQVVIKVQYGLGEYSKMPLNNLQLNSEGKKYFFSNLGSNKFCIKMNKHEKKE